MRSWAARCSALTGENPTEPAFSSDGQIVLRSEGRLTTYQVEPALEYRALVQPSRQPRAFHRPSIRHDNRLLAVGRYPGVVLWDLARGTECAFLPIGVARQVMFEATGDLLTSGANGVQRWPVRLDPDRNEFRIGPPQVLPFARNTGHIAEDRLGRIIATSRKNHAEVRISGRLTAVGPLDECRYVAVSPDGEWLATGSDDWGAQVWRVRDGEKVAEFPIDTGTAIVSACRLTIAPGGRGQFSPQYGHGRRLQPGWEMAADGTSALQALDDRNLGLSRELGGTGLCFSPDSRLVALLDASRIIRLVEAETGRVIARLESPDSLDVIWATFSPDGSRLVLVPIDHPAVYVWDLRAIRKRLAAMGLDWDVPAYPDDDPAAASLPPLPPLRVDLGPSAGEPSKAGAEESLP